ncbi:MAG: Endonuclease 4 [Chlamydiae bacterium]|nr:Endonuclease 4 [Chlamydiota bacterium]
MEQEKLLIGAHTSAAGGVFNALLEGQKIGATTIQLFTSNQKQWKGKEYTQKELDLWAQTLEETGIEKIMSHDSYLINLGAPNPEVLEKSRRAFQEEIKRCHLLGITYMNFHPGAALKEDRQQCLDRIVESLLECEDLVSKGPTMLILESTAGQGSTVGYLFEELGYIVDKVKDRLPVGVCIDTCHSFAAGYDIRTEEGWEKTLKEFDEQVGIEFLKAFHLNDSKKGLGSRVDRHEQIGEGEIGLECFRVLMNHPKTRHLPKYLETPGGPARWVDEIALLLELAKGKSCV